MKRLILLGMLFTLFLGLSATVLPEGPPGLDSDFAIEQADLFETDEVLSEATDLTLVNEAEVEISPGDFYLVSNATNQVTNYTCVAYTSCSTKGNVVTKGVKSKGSNREDLFKSTYIVNEVLLEISPGDRV